MELFTILLSALLGIFSPVGFAVDRVAESAIRKQIQSAETLAVRVDNAPSYQLWAGKVERVRIAGRGIYPISGIRIAVLELETDPIAVDPGHLRQGKVQLAQPLNAGVRIVVTAADLNRALQSPQISKKLRDLSLDFLGSPGQQLERYEFVNPQVEFLNQQRLRFQTQLKSQQSDTQIAITVESGIQINSGRQLQLVEPTATINGRPLPPQLIKLLVGGIDQRLDLANLQAQGITARVLSWQLDRQQLSLAAFVQIDPKFTNRTTPKPAAK
jgi:hypothetical protein